MATTTKKTKKDAATAGRDGPWARKSAVTKTRKLAARKPKSTKPEADKREPVLSETATLKEQLTAARMQQAASAEILRAVANVSGDAAGPLQLIAETTARLFEASSVSIQIAEGKEFTQEYRVGAIAKRVGSAYPRSIIKVGGRNLPGTVVAESRQIHIADLDHLDPSMSDFPGLPHARAGGARTVCGTPLRREGNAIGALIVFRDRLLPFTDDELALLQSFADQAVIAIENARLFNETKEALERQAATSDILRVISQSPTDVQPVFDAIVLTSVRLTGCDLAFFLRCDGATYLQMARATPKGLETDARPPQPIDPDANFPSRAIVANKTLHLPDWSQLDLPPYERWVHETYGIVSSLYLPLTSAGECICLLVLAGKRTNIFGASEIALAESFRDQAEIAIRNARLFDEVQAKTRDLEESLQQQTATADVLKVISRSAFDLDTVLNTLARSASELCEAEFCGLYLRDGDFLKVKGTSNIAPELMELVRNNDIPIDDQSYSGRAVLSRQYNHVEDFLADNKSRFTKNQEILNFRTILHVPLVRDDIAIGMIALGRLRVEPFTQRQIELVQTFAGQAVIAIENVRLFDEVQQRTRDLSEALQQQTATADVLKVISRSAFDLQTVLETLIRSAVDLCGASRGIVTLRDGDLFHFRAHSHPHENPDWMQFLRQHPQKAGRNSASARAIQSGEIVCVPDVLADPEIDMPATALAGIRAVLAVPLLRDGRVEGLMVLSHPTPGPFSARQIELVETFADQAIIAIENVRLFDEVQARTRDLTEALTYQTGSSNILRVIAASPTDVAPVLKAIVESACELCEANDAIVYLRDGDDLRFSAHHGPLAFTVEKWPIDRSTAAGRAFVDRAPVHIHDVLSAEGDPFPDGQRAARRIGVRTMLGVPLLREGESIGTILLRRTDVHPFSDKQIALLQTFADQAVIAIGNVRLFEEVQAKTRELSTSLDDLRTAQDRLVQTEKLASLGQLTAGIAHEIKNPLNFVNNFAALSRELIDELNDVLKPAALDGKTREEIGELTDMLKGNLEKVVQHGKRADSIVKNMLLHSREGSGEHRPTDINAIVDESLNLAYHGARAEKPGFNVTLQRNLDPKAGMIDLYPQEITRVFLNLISNGFYAAAKRKETGEEGFEPALSAATKDLGDRVEIRIRDNGTGIPFEVKEKMFNPFFTTKPAGEGTGLGLSMSHDIVVKQHGGIIDVETEPGAFTEFIVTLPRNAAV